MTLGTPLDAVREVAENVFRVDVNHPAPGQTCSYLIVHNGAVAVIDCGGKLGADSIMAALKSLALPPDAVQWLILTHVHLDHAAAAGALMQKLPQAVTVGHSTTIKHMIDPESRLVPATMELYGGKFFAEFFGKLIPIAADRTHIVEDGDRLLLGDDDRQLEIVYSPGHAWHHISIYDAATSFVATGDAYGVSFHEVGKGDNLIIVPVTPPTQFNPEATIDSIHRLRALGARTAGLSHFDVVPDSDEIVRQQLAAMDDWQATAKRMFEENREDFKTRMFDYLMNWIIERACPLGADEAVIRRCHQTDCNLSSAGFKHLLEKQLTENSNS